MRPRFPSLLLHLSLTIVVIGAFVTHFCGTEEYIHMRVREAESRRWAATGFTTCLPSPELQNFTIEYHPDGTVRDYVSIIQFEDGSTARVSMNRIARHDGWRFIQSGYDPDGRGSTLLAVHDPWGIGITFCGYFMLFAAILLLLADPHGTFRTLLRHPAWRKGRFDTAAWCCTGAVVFWAAFAAFMQFRVTSGRLAPILATPLLSVHVSTIALAYLLFAAVAVISVIVLASGKKSETAEDMAVISRTLLYPAVLLLCAGIFIGAIWASISWGRYWSWDPKETCALVTMLIYCIPLHLSFRTARSEGRTESVLCLLGFAAVLFTFLGVNLLGGMHAYM